MSRRRLLLWFPLLVCTLITACGGGGGGSGGSGPAPTPQSQTITFAQAGPLNVLFGSTTANAASAGAGTGTVTYASSNTNAVTVDSAGNATAVGIGTATITATKAADANYLQAQATYTINSQTADQVSAFIGPSSAEVSLPASANGKQFGRARAGNCTATDTVLTCAGAQLDPVNGAPINDTTTTLGVQAYYAIVNGSTAGPQIDVRADRFSGRIGHAVAFFKNRYWLIGGGEPIYPVVDVTNIQYTAKADVWSSADGRSWKLETADGGFGARYFHRVVVFNNRLWIITGEVPSNNPPFLTDVWSSADGVTWQKEADDSGLPWHGASLNVVVFNNQMLAVAGGATYTSTTGAFTPLSAPGALTGTTTFGRQHATLTIYNNQLWFIAGRVHYPLGMIDTGGVMNDVWTSADGITWTQVTANAQFAPRYEHVSFVANGRLWVLGGHTAVNGIAGSPSGDAWSSTDGLNWTLEHVNTLATSYFMQVVQETNKATAISGVQAAFANNVFQTTDGANWSELTTYAPFSPRLTSGTEFNGQMWVVGGNSSAASASKAVRNDAWHSADGINWSQATPSGPIFSPRDGHAVVAFNNKLWVIGGWDDVASAGGTGGTSTRVNDVWSSPDGVSWTQQIPAGGVIFSPRTALAAVVYNGKLWVIGGDIASGTPNDTYANDVWSTMDGTTWVNATANAAFSARGGHSLAVFNNALWLIGGDSGGSGSADVWTSTDGITWTQKAPAGVTFPGRTRHGSAVLNGRLYVVGGAASTTYGTQYGDVLSSADGTNWRSETTAAAWPGRSQFPLFVHGNELWLAGGFGAATLNDVWRSSDGVSWRVGFTHAITAP